VSVDERSKHRVKGGGSGLMAGRLPCQSGLYSGYDARSGECLLARRERYPKLSSWARCKGNFPNIDEE
jgi:hypothetical protein